jgi:hypothetical protein
MKEWVYQCKTPKPTVCPYCGVAGFIGSAGYCPDVDVSTEEGRKAAVGAHLDHRCYKCKERLPATEMELVEVDNPEAERERP